MAARAMWKGVIHLGEMRVPVKLYAAVEDRDVHFRLLHAADQAPVKQILVNPETDAVVAYSDARRAFRTEEGDWVLLREEELETAEPRESREIQIVQFLPPQTIDHRWYVRPYYLGSDESDSEAYFALTEALARTGREGLARWVMRGKAYAGALRLQFGYPLLISLRHAEEVVAVEELPMPEGPSLDERELKMAQQLVEMLAAEFEPDQYHDEYRERVEKLIETKRRGGKVRRLAKPKPRPAQDLARALEASLKQERRHA